ncbi:MAG: type III-A CRISPR-associated protein Csm2 [Deltaproteobacteria bacterium]|nr:type III-A CRISPR-associated protein Csm2 [Deltaproteobacteria bacterium]MBW1993595.1 type III-A CRISPR-associated protein Csm2 [Deltaproteobacteria bacterium]MBW2153810.1 type III-A CRISPR-associated protein Csm2 [Deltaproteobacteria bacterium]
MQQQSKTRALSSSGHGKSGKRRNSEGSKITQLPEPKPLQYYRDPEKKVLDSDLIDERAKEWAQSFSISKTPLKTAQMRRFYDELKAIERKIMTGKDSKEQELNFQKDRALIIMFKAKAVYAQKRNVAPKQFTQFIFDHLASIDDLKDFQAFLKVFEAVVAFHKFFSPEK